MCRKNDYIYINNTHVLDCKGNLIEHIKRMKYI